MHWQAASFGTTGPHALGTTGLRLHTRAEEGGRATLQVRLWYPVDQTEPTRARALAQFLYRLRHFRLAPAWHGAEPTRELGRLPLITYVHDIADGHEANSHLLADLASHGFVLAAIHDPFGRRISHSSLRRSEQSTDEGEQQSLAHGVRTALVLLDALQELEQGDRTVWGDCIDLRNVGIMGYALGGGVAAEATHLDKRYVAAANLAGPISARLVTVPYLAMLTDFQSAHPTPSQPAPINAREALHYRRARQQARLPQGHVIQIEGTRKEHFGGLIGNASIVPGAQQPVSPTKHARTIIKAYTAAFFGTYLRNHKHPLMYVRHSPYAEVRFVPPSTPRRIDWPPGATQ
jgi:dienelactone hydrolase